MKQILAIMAVIVLMSAPVIAQEIDYCEGDFDCDGDQDGSDASKFKTDFGRSTFKNPCPPPNPAPSLVPKTGQTVSYEQDDDGDLEKGVTWPNPRFTDNGDGTVTDNLTGLIWLKDANCSDLRFPPPQEWYYALWIARELASGACGLTDGSNAGDWRLPNVKELQSLIDFGNYNPALPSGHPFINVQSDNYWSSTSYTYFEADMWYVSLNTGYVGKIQYIHFNYVWPVRGGQ